MECVWVSLSAGKPSSTETGNTGMVKDEDNQSEEQGMQQHICDLNNNQANDTALIQ